MASMRTMAETFVAAKKKEVFPYVNICIHIYYIGSSQDYPDILTSSEFNYYLSDYPIINPLMYNWNTVYVRYCDGSSYAGDAIQEYQGRYI